MARGARRSVASAPPTEASCPPSLARIFLAHIPLRMAPTLEQGGSAQPSASWLPGGFLQRQFTPQAAQGSQLASANQALGPRPAGHIGPIFDTGIHAIEERWNGAPLLWWAPFRWVRRVNGVLSSLVTPRLAR